MTASTATANNVNPIRDGHLSMCRFYHGEHLGDLWSAAGEHIGHDEVEQRDELQ